MTRHADLVVFSHLRWDFVWQRPQHLITRLARHRRVFFVEEPERREGAPSWRNTVAADNLLICRPQTPITAPGFSDEQMPALTVNFATPTPPPPPSPSAAASPPAPSAPAKTKKK